MKDSPKIFIPIQPSTAQETLNITTHYKSIPKNKTVYVIQAKIDGKWQDVDFYSDSIPEKKAIHYRDKNNVETRVIRIKENCLYSYEYDIIDQYFSNTNL